MGDNRNCFMDLKFHTVDVYLILKGTMRLVFLIPVRPQVYLMELMELFLKIVQHPLQMPLSLLFNISFVTGCIPDEWKLASVVPVHKKSDEGCVDNYI